MKFYKYRPMGDTGIPWVERIVLHNELYFAPAAKFNDPFDLRPSLSFEATHEERVKAFIRLASTRKPGLTPVQIEAEAERLVAAAFDPANFAGTAASMGRGLTGVLTEHVGGFCASGKRDDILMWSHYADSHRGICLEFDEACPLFAAAQQVKYSKFRSPINRYSDDYDAMAEKALLTKSDHWKYEAEWRSLRLDEGPGTVRFAPEHLTGIVIGACATNATVERVKEWTAMRSTPWTVYQATVNDGAFVLDVVRR